MSREPSTVSLRVRYSETDQMGTFYNARALEWFECVRSEVLRDAGVPYTMMEERGIFLPIVEAHVQYIGRARYDDELILHGTAEMAGKARIRFEITIDHKDGRGSVAKGFTVHAVTDASGKPVRAPKWLVSALRG